MFVSLNFTIGDIARYISMYRECSARASSLVNALEDMSKLQSSDHQLMPKLKRIAEELKNVYDEKKESAKTINNFIKEKKSNSYKEVRQSEPSDMDMDISSPCVTSTPNPKEEESPPNPESKQKRKRGRKPKKILFEIMQESTEVASGSTGNLMLLADVALEKENEKKGKKPKGALKITEKKVIKRRRRQKIPKVEEPEPLPEPVEDESQDDDKDTALDEPMYCVCIKASFGSMVECSNEVKLRNIH